jgi:uncharacterized membrane protein
MAGKGAMELGPVQVIVIGVEDGEFSPEIVAELRDLHNRDAIRLIDLLLVQRNGKGEIERIEQGDLGVGGRKFGAIAGELLGLTAEGWEAAEPTAGGLARAGGEAFGEDEVWYLADAIPNGSSAAIALIEHRWAIPLRDAITRARGQTLADSWIHPDDLAAIGAP